MKSVQVLLSSYNGEKYIKEQLDSLLLQEKVKLDILVRDDGSSDRTLEILNDYQGKNQNIRVVKGENLGVVESFFSLISDSADCDYYAFCDQDDVWDTDKLYQAVVKLDENPIGPAMYYSGLRIVDENLNLLDTKCDLHVLSIDEVMLSNNATGCTMVINKSLMRLLKEHKPSRVVMHDHWIYALCVVVGGNVVYDITPHISYRQHEHNVIGHKMSLKKRIRCSSFCNNRNIRSGIAKELLSAYSSRINTDCNEVLNLYANYQSGIEMGVHLWKRAMKAIPKLKRKFIFTVELILKLF